MSTGSVCVWKGPSVPLLVVCLSQLATAASHTNRNYYEILNVKATAAVSLIKTTFRRLALKYHPDRDSSSDAENTFREIAEAYTVLSDKRKRRLYDALGHEAFLKDEASVRPKDADETSFQFSFSDLFQDFADGSFGEESPSHQSSCQEWEDEDGYYSSEGAGFSFYAGGGDEEERHRQA